MRWEATRKAKRGSFLLLILVNATLYKAGRLPHTSWEAPTYKLGGSHTQAGRLPHTSWETPTHKLGGSHTQAGRLAHASWEAPTHNGPPRKHYFLSMRCLSDRDCAHLRAAIRP
eukprot:363130-Chlamydomonas_euryale.AAC.7